MNDRPLPAPRTPGSPASRRRVLHLAAAGLAAVATAACGKKGDPSFPPDTIPGAPRARRDNSKVYPD
ncbi:MAG: hypothetical protein RIB84_01690 [Sneathiellaceae bacterium]